MKQNKTPLIVYPILGFIMMSMIQVLIRSNTRYVFAAGLLGAAVWTMGHLLSNLILRNLNPYKPESSYYKPETHTPLTTTVQDASEIKMTDLLMDRAHIGYYLTLDTVVGPGMSTRRGYTTMGGGPDCNAPPITMMTFPDFIPQIPCKTDES